MTRDQQFFIDTLADYMWQRKTNPPEWLDWNQVIAYAGNHQVEGIIWNQCKEYLLSKSELKEIRRRLETTSVGAVFIYGNNRYSSDELKTEFRKENIRFFFIKGMDVADLYPTPAYRTMNDMDIVMSSEDQNRIHDILIRLGYRQEVGEQVRVYRRGITLLEIHCQLVNSENIETSFRRTYFNDCWKYVKDNGGIGELDWNFHFLFLIEHTKQHFSANGVGFRQFMDIAVTAMNQKNLNWLWIEQELRRIDLWEFASVAAAFCKKWWGINVPLGRKDLDENFYNESTDFVFKNGVFGHNNENSSIHLAEKQMRVSSLPTYLQTISVAIKKVCISYNAAVMLPYLSFVKGNKYLLPFAWVYRVFYVAIKKRGNISRAMKLVFGSGKVKDYHRRLMDQWGI